MRIGGVGLSNQKKVETELLATPNGKYRGNLSVKYQNSPTYTGIPNININESNFYGNNVNLHEVKNDFDNDDSINVWSIKDPVKRKRVQRALQRYNANIKTWANSNEYYQDKRNKKNMYKLAQGPKRTILELQNQYTGSILPSDIQEDLYERYQQF